MNPETILLLSVSAIATLTLDALKSRDPIVLVPSTTALVVKSVL